MPVSDAALLIQRGALCVYPTETFFALGCDARNPEAVARLLVFKQRPKEQGLPCIIGGMEQLELACDLAARADFPAALGRAARELMERFWPGPLSLVLPAASGLAPGITRGAEVALRLTPHPAAQALCLQAQTPLVASSANRRGEPPASSTKNLNPELLQVAEALVDQPPAPAGGAPSTLARLAADADGRPGLLVLRQGAVPAASLEAAGYPILGLCGGCG